MIELQVFKQGEKYAREKIGQRIREKFPGGVERILLINPPQTTRDVFDVKVAKDGNYPCYQPYNIALLSRGLEERGYKTELLDMNYEILRRAYDSNNEFNFVNEWENLFKERLNKFKPDFVGIPCMFTMNYTEVKSLAEYVKKNHPNMPIIVE